MYTFTQINNKLATYQNKQGQLQTLQTNKMSQVQVQSIEKNLKIINIFGSFVLLQGITKQCYQYGNPNMHKPFLHHNGPMV